MAFHTKTVGTTTRPTGTMCYVRYNPTQIHIGGGGDGGDHSHNLILYIICFDAMKKKKNININNIFQ